MHGDGSAFEVSRSLPLCSHSAADHLHQRRLDRCGGAQLLGRSWQEVNGDLGGDLDYERSFFLVVLLRYWSD